jgi:uncharacterized protein YvpB
METSFLIFSLFSLFMTIFTLFLAQSGFTSKFFKNIAFIYSSLFLTLSILSSVIFFAKNDIGFTIMKKVPAHIEQISAFPPDNDKSSIKKDLTDDLQEKVLLDAPLISQLPELPRGCEVTSLAMMLNHATIEVDKMTLAKKVKKDPTPYQVKNGNIHFGNPHDGFVGNMYTFDKPGHGVYHAPIKDLAEKYLPHQIIDFTGEDFDQILYHLNNGSPVWIVINTEFTKLPESSFQTWRTPSGLVDITYKEHSVLVTGYDKDYIYFNDPLTYTKNQKAPKANFKAAWVQMGSQAITYIHSIKQ